MNMTSWISRHRYQFVAGCAAGLAIMGAVLSVRALTTQASAASCPTRIVSLSPTATESLFAIGAGRQVVAVDSDSDYPTTYSYTAGGKKVTKKVPRKAGLSAYSPNAEAVAVDYNPNLVVVSYDANKVIEQLKTLGVRVLYQPTAKNLAAAYSQIETLGSDTCHRTQAVNVVHTMERQIAAIRSDVGNKSHGLSYYDEISAPPYDYAASSKSFIGQLFGLLGMHNITNASSGFPELSQEYIVKASPELIFLSDNQPNDGGVTIASVEHRTGWKTIGAVKTRAIFDLNDDAASRWGPRIVVLMREISTAVFGYVRAHPRA
jgi:iron complex transport system substrate-binding protein